jgi:hypothetical protein
MNEILLPILVTAVGAVVTVWIGGFAVGSIVSPYADQLDADSGLKKGGRLIGYCERLLIYVFVLANAPSAIGFLIAAKSIYSFGESSGEKQHKRSQYVIIGTLVSFAYAVTVSYLVRWTLRVML